MLLEVWCKCRWDKNSENVTYKRVFPVSENGDLHVTFRQYDPCQLSID